MVTIAKCNHHYSIVPYAPLMKKSRATHPVVSGAWRALG